MLMLFCSEWVHFTHIARMSHVTHRWVSHAHVSTHNSGRLLINTRATDPTNGKIVLSHYFDYFLGKRII